jgi:hypothetical protein
VASRLAFQEPNKPIAGEPKLDAVAQHPANADLLKQWIKHWTPLAYRAVEGLVELLGQAPRPLQFQAVAAKVQAAHHALLTRCGLNTIEA